MLHGREQTEVLTRSHGAAAGHSSKAAKSAGTAWGRGGDRRLPSKALAPSGALARPSDPPSRTSMSSEAIRGRALLAALTLALAAGALLHRLSWACGGGGGHRPGQAHNPLELWSMANVRVEAAPGANGPPGGPSIRCNATSFARQHAWVQVAWSGVPAGALAPRCAHHTAQQSTGPHPTNYSSSLFNKRRPLRRLHCALPSGGRPTRNRAHQVGLGRPLPLPHQAGRRHARVSEEACGLGGGCRARLWVGTPLLCYAAAGFGPA